MSRVKKTLLIGLTVFVVLAAIGAATSSNSNNPSATSTTNTSLASYPVNVQDNFLNACEGRSSIGFCDCALTWLEAHVPISGFVQEEVALEKTGKFPALWAAGIAGCVGK